MSHFSQTECDFSEDWLYLVCLWLFNGSFNIDMLYYIYCYAYGSTSYKYYQNH